MSLQISLEIALAISVCSLCPRSDNNVSRDSGPDRHLDEPPRDPDLDAAGDR